MITDEEGYKVGVAPMRPAEKQANDLLVTAWFPAEIGFAIPVDPFYIAGKLGLEVYDAGFADETSGMLVKRAGQDAEIYVNRHHSENRRRFSCAHELGHYVLRASSEDQGTWGYIDRRDRESAEGTNRAEIYANQFAAELLMPRENVEHLAASLDDAALAVRFTVSLGAMRYRLENLGIR